MPCVSSSSILFFSILLCLPVGEQHTGVARGLHLRGPLGGTHPIQYDKLHCIFSYYSFLWETHGRSPLFSGRPRPHQAPRVAMPLWQCVVGILLLPCSWSLICLFCHLGWLQSIPHKVPIHSAAQILGCLPIYTHNANHIREKITGK